MSERAWMEPIVERVVAEVFESHTAQMRSEIVRRVLEEIAAHPIPDAAPAVAAPATASGAAELGRAVSEIHSGSSQKEILRALLDACGRYAARTALFVVKGGHASGWQGRGFSDNDAIKDFSLDVKASAILQAISERSTVNAPVGDLDGHFLEKFGSPQSGEARLLPLLLKDKVAALVYADSGTEAGGAIDAGSLDLLVLTTSSWLEVNSLRKQAHKEPAQESTPEHGDAPPAPVASAQAFNDPFAGHAPAYAMAAAASAEVAPPVSPTVAEPAPASFEPPPPLESAAEPAVEPSQPSAPETAAVSAEDEETCRKAQRFARLLVDEIKLYNQAKVTEGRKNKDLYDRLKDAIEKSRITYQKRYGNTVASSREYFQHELVRSLAEDDISIMGAHFRL